MSRFLRKSTAKYPWGDSSVPHDDKVLLIVATDSDRATYRHFLDQAGQQTYQVVEWNRGKKALVWCQENRADGILLGDRLEDMDALEFIQQLSQQQEEHPLPLIFLCNAGDVATAVRAMKLGAQDCLDKTQVTPMALQQAMQPILQQVTPSKQYIPLTEASDGHSTHQPQYKQIEQRLHEYENKLRLLFQYAPVSIAIFDHEMRYIMASQRWIDEYELQSKTVEDYVGCSHYELFPTIPERWKQIHQRCLSGASETCQEDSFIQADGSLKWMRWAIQPWYKATDTVGGIIIFAEDITPGKTAEVALSENAVRLRLAQLASKSGVWDWNITTGKIFWSREYYELYGLDSSIESTYENWLQCIHPDDRKRVTQQVLQAIEDGSPELRIEFRIVRSGAIRWFAGIGQIFHDDQGVPIRSIGITLDITNRKQAEIALKKSQTQLQEILDASEVVVFLKDPAGKHLLVNKQYEVITQRTAKEVLGKTDFEVFPAAVATILQHHDQYVLKTGEPLRVEETVLLPTGSQTYLSLKFPLHDTDGTIYAVCGMATNITELKQTQAALQTSNAQLQQTNEALQKANLVKDAFLRMISHELRTPLNPILGMAEGLQEKAFGPLNDRQHEAIAMILHNGQRLLNLINNLLDLIDLECHKIHLDCDFVFVKDLCRASVEYIKALADAKAIQLQMTIHPTIDTMQADGNRLKQVLTQLLDNAIKFTPTGGTIVLEVQPSINPSFIQFSVKDSGIGIPKEKQDMLFQPFVQMDDRLNRHYEGLGIGLVLAQRLVELHGGTITVTSQLGQGSCFTVQIPIHACNPLSRGDRL